MPFSKYAPLTFGFPYGSLEAARIKKDYRSVYQIKHSKVSKPKFEMALSLLEAVLTRPPCGQPKSEEPVR